MPMRAGGEAGGVAGQVARRAWRPRSRRWRDRTRTTSAIAPFAEHAAVAQPEQRRRRAGDELHRALERHQLTAAQAVGEEARGVGRAAHAVEVRTGVGAADHRPRVVPHLAAQLPRRAVVVLRHRPRARCAGRRRSRCRAACRSSTGRARPRSSRDDAAAQRLVLGGVHVAERGSRPSRRGGGTRPPPATATARAAQTRVSGSRQAFDALGHRHAETSLPARQQPDRAEVEEAHVHRHAAPAW